MGILRPDTRRMSGFDPTQISGLLEAQFSGDSAFIEQAGLYLNPSSAARWCVVANQADYTEAQAGAPFVEIARHISQYYLKGIKDFDIFALGSGDGRNETRLTQQLMQYIQPINLLLLDVSQPLLRIAYHHATSTLGPASRFHVLPIEGNMYHLGHGAYVELYNPQAKNSRRLITMLGYTLGNLFTPNEQMFINDSLNGFAAGDLLLADLWGTWAPAEEPEEVRRLDPSLLGKIPPGQDAAMNEFLSDTIYHYCRGAMKVEFYRELDYTSCSIPGSYAVVLRARVHFHDGRKKTFTVKIWRRYDLKKFVDAVEKLGWRGSTGWSYGRKRQFMYLFEKIK